VLYYVSVSNFPKGLVLSASSLCSPQHRLYPLCSQTASRSLGLPCSQTVRKGTVLSQHSKHKPWEPAYLGAISNPELMTGQRNGVAFGHHWSWGKSQIYLKLMGCAGECGDPWTQKGQRNSGWAASNDRHRASTLKLWLTSSQAPAGRQWELVRYSMKQIGRHCL
jgi:hypothetical protein